MATRWETVVSLAREVDAAFAKGKDPDATTVARLARAVVDFQKELSAPNGATRASPNGSG